MTRIRSLLGALLLLTGPAAAQVPSTMAPNTVICRLGISAGPPQACPVSAIFTAANVQEKTANLTALLALGSTGFPTRTGTNTWAQRTITGTANEIAVANGGGIAGNPTISLPGSITLTGKTMTGGLFAGGAFNGTLGATTPSTIAGTTAALSGTLTQSGGYAYVGNFNGGGLFPAASNGLAVDLNSTSGALDIGLHNTHTGSTESFTFSQLTGASSSVYLASFFANGNFGFGTRTPDVAGAGGGNYFTHSSDHFGANALAVVAVGGNITSTAQRFATYAFYNSAIVASDKRVAQIIGSTDGATNSGKIELQTYNAGTEHAWLSIDHLGATSLAGAVTANTFASSAATITGGSITGMPNPSANSDVATKAYADAIAGGISPRVEVAWATAAVLPNTPTYANGASGVGATLTAGSNAAIAVDGGSPSLNDRVLVKNQAATLQNGVYTVTTVGSGGAAWVLTRATDFDAPAEMTTGAAFVVTGGSTNIGKGFTLAATVAAVGTDPATFNLYQTVAGSLLVASNLSDLANKATARTNLGVAIGTDVQAFDADLSALAANGTNGLWAHTGAGTGAARTIAGTANEITLTNGDGVSGNPTVSLPSAITLAGKTTTGGTITGAALNGTLGATTPSTISGTTATLNGALTHSGGFAYLGDYNTGAGVFPSASKGLAVDLNSTNGSLDVGLHNTYTAATESFTFSQLTGASSSVYLADFFANGNFGFGTRTPVTSAATARYWTLSADGLGANVASVASIGGNITSTSFPAGIFAFYNSALGTSEKRIADIVGFTDGATNSGRIALRTYNAGTQSEWLTVDHLGAVAIPGKDCSGSGGFVTVAAGGALGCAAGSGSGVGSTGGTVGQILIKQSSTNAATAYFDPASFNVASSPSTNCNVGGGTVATDLQAVTSGFTNAFVPPGCNIYINADQTIGGAGKTFTVACGGTITVNSGKTLTIRSAWQDPGFCQVFAGSGTATGIAKARPEYWGCAHSSGSTDTPCIQKAINSATNGSGSDTDEFAVLLGCYQYFLDATLTVTLSSGSSIRMRGCGSVGTNPTVLMAKSSFTGTSAMFVGAPSTNCCFDFKLSDFTILNQAAAGGPANGLEIGSSGPSYINSLSTSHVENVTVAGFATQFYIHDILLVIFHDINASASDSSGVEKASSVCYNINTAFSGGFTGSLDFYNPICVGPLGSGSPSGIGAQVVGTGSGNTISAVRWHFPIFYGSSVQMDIAATSGGVSNDQWVLSGQFEGPSPGTSIAVQGIFNSSAVTNGDLHFDHNYMSGNGFNEHFYITGTGIMQLLWISNNMLANPNGGNPSIYVSGVGGSLGNFRGINVSNNLIHGPGDGAAHQDAIILDTVSRAMVANNTVDCVGGGTSRPYLIAVLNSSWGNIVGNSSGGCFSTGAYETGGSSNVLANTTTNN